MMKGAIHLVLVPFMIGVAQVSCSPEINIEGKIPEADERNATAPFLREGHSPVPGRKWQVWSPEKAKLNPAAVKRLDDFLFPDASQSLEQKAGFPRIQTEGVVIVHRGKIVYERYANGYTEETPHLTWSVSKGFLNALIGIAVRQRRISLGDPAFEYYPPLDRAGHRKIAIKHLLGMSTGLEWNEGYEANPLNSSVINMLYSRGFRDMGRFTATKPVAHQPGSYWYYSSGDSNLLSAVLRMALGKNEYARYPWKRLFEPLGMESVTWEQDHAGTYIASSYLYATPRDMARFGLLYLNNGVWRGRRIFNRDWVRYSTTMVPSFYTTPVRADMEEDNPGRHLFLNLGDEKRGLNPPWPSAPRDTFAFTGHWGQIIVVIPSKNVVAVRVANDREESMDKNEFLEHIVAVVDSVGDAGSAGRPAARLATMGRGH